MNNIQDQLEKVYKELFVGNSINSIEINMIADEYLEYEEGRVWLTEGGIEIKFQDDRIASFTYEEEEETNEIKFLCVESELLPFITQYDYYPIDLSESQGYVNILEEKIISVDINWVTFDTLDYLGRVEQTDVYPLGFIFHFENGQKLQIASIETKLNMHNQEFAYLKYKLEGQILISFNHIFEIN
jgi:hypothetical protein